MLAHKGGCTRILCCVSSPTQFLASSGFACARRIVTAKDRARHDCNARNLLGGIIASCNLSPIAVNQRKSPRREAGKDYQKAQTKVNQKNKLSLSKKDL